MNDIDCDGMALPMLGVDGNNPFRGIFDGQGYTISNYTASTGGYMGLFGYNAGTIMNLNVKNFNITVNNLASASTVYLGGIAGYNMGKIQRCTSIGGTAVAHLNSETPRVGLIAGYNSGTIENCGASGNVCGTIRYDSADYVYAGGIAGTNNAIIANCWANASVQAGEAKWSTHYYSGGIAGNNTTSATYTIASAQAPNLSASRNW